MDRKGLAVSQIVLLVLGILVLAVVAYLLYTNFISSQSGFDVNKCKAALISACTSWKVSGFSPASAPPWPSACGTGVKDFGSPDREKIGRASCTSVGVI